LELEDMADIEPSLDQGESEGLARFIVPAVIVLVMAVAGWFTYKSLGGKGHEPKRQTVKIAPPERKAARAQGAGKQAPAPGAAKAPGNAS